jgi:tripartite-type tricarboxylate transporter receptor subunit TctC
MIFSLFLRPLPKLARGIIDTSLSALLALVLAVTFGHAAADDYPSRPIRIIVPLAAGGSSDAAARLAAAALSRHINQSVIVENRAGGGGAVGTEAAAHADPDGYTLLLSNAAAFTVIPNSRKVNYDVEKDFVALGQILSAPQALVVDADSKFKSVRELVEYARANPDKISFGSAGIGTTTHLSIQLLQQDASISLVHVPYRATNLSVADVISHSIDAVFGDIATLVSLVNGGKLKALATTGDTRSPLLPDAPTMVELGYPKVRTVNWFGLHVSSGTPNDIQQRLKQAVEAMQTDPEFRAMLAKNATSTGTVGADAFDKMIHEERERLAPVIRALGPIN